MAGVQKTKFPRTPNLCLLKKKKKKKYANLEQRPPSTDIFQVYVLDCSISVKS